MPKNIKLIASDYDWTFHRRDDKDYNNNLSAVTEWRNSGKLFAFTTGRDVASMLYEKNSRNIDFDYLVSLNGSFVVDRDNNVLFKKAFSDKIAREITGLLKEKFGNELIISNGFDGYNKTNSKASKSCEVAKEVFERNSKIYTETIESALNNNVLLIGCLSDSFETATAVKEEILEKYADEVEVFINLSYINIVPKGISKATGLDVVLNHASIDQDNVKVIGDDYNDIPMIEKYNGYAVDSAKTDVKDIASKIYDSVSDLIKEYL